MPAAPADNEPTYATVTCDFCQAANDMTLLNVVDQQEVRCSSCGASLGSMADILDQAEPTDPDEDEPMKREP